MGLFSKDIKTIDDLFTHTLRDVYDAENQILKALPGMAEKASDLRLKDVFEQHLGETEDRLRRLENVFQILGVTPKGVKCPAIDGILEEADDVSGETADEAVLDAALIASAQAVAHYAIARYGALFAWAKALGREECAQLLSETLAEEKNADRNLSSLAEGRINRKAA